MDAVESGSFADRADPPISGAGVQATAVAADQDRPIRAFADGAIDGAGGAGTSGTPAGLVPLPTLDRLPFERNRPVLLTSAPALWAFVVFLPVFVAIVLSPVSG